MYGNVKGMRFFRKKLKNNLEKINNLGNRLHSIYEIEKDVVGFVFFKESNKQNDILIFEDKKFLTSKEFATKNNFSIWKLPACYIWSKTEGSFIPDKNRKSKYDFRGMIKVCKNGNKWIGK